MKNIIPFNLILQTDRVILRPIVLEDYNAFKKLTSDESMWLYFTSDLSVPSELKKWVDQAVSDLDKGTRIAFTMMDKSSNKVVGSTSIGNISARDRRAEIGWTWLGKEYWGSGINDDAKHLLVNYVLETLDFERVEFKTDVLNMPARGALRRIGAVEEGILRSHTLMTHSRRRDTIYYSILKSEWDLVKSKINWLKK